MLYAEPQADVQVSVPASAAVTYVWAKTGVDSYGAAVDLKDHVMPKVTFRLAASTEL
jgi:hypothetical protein